MADFLRKMYVKDDYYEELNSEFINSLTNTNEERELLNYIEKRNSIIDPKYIKKNQV